MILRKNFIPKSFVDLALTLSVIVFIPIVYWFEIFVVLPAYYGYWNFWYVTHLVCGNFLMYNLIGNYVGLMLCDTSIKGHMMPTTMSSGWRFCVMCETIAPPRSWHCEKCKTCILKRDHHCLFSGCCVGHGNSRYFICFLLYAFISCVYSSYFNLFYIYEYVDFNNYFSWLSFIFPLASFLATTARQQFYILIFLFLVIFSIFTGFLLIYHMTLILNGQVTHEQSTNYVGYNYGQRKNCELVFGQRMYLCLLSPLIKSHQDHDGIHWEALDTLKTK